MKQLTIKDLLDGELKSNGFGLYKHEIRQSYFWRSKNNPYFILQELDETIVNVANSLEFSNDQLFEFMDSRMGRHLGDEIGSMKAWNTTALDQLLVKWMKEYLFL